MTTNWIQNREEILSYGHAALRRDVLAILEAGLHAGDPGEGTRRVLRRSGNRLFVGDRSYLLEKINHIYVVGAGKGAFPIVAALEEILGPDIAEGVAVVKKGEARRLRHVEIHEAGHPVPDEASVEGAKKILGIVKKAGDRDLVFAAVTGGSSALVTLPPEGITLAAIQELNNLLLKSGAVIREMNIVRKHLCRMKGGRLAAYIQPAEAITLTLDTAPEGMPWPDMCLADPSTFQEAIYVLQYYDLWETVSPSIREYLQEGRYRPEWETVKSLEGMKTRILTVGDPVSMCLAAAEAARKLKYEAHILGTQIEGEAREVGIFLAGMAREILKCRRPFQPPCALISGGEMTVTIRGPHGAGGPNQEMVLGFLKKMSSPGEYVCASLDSDGTDGPTPIAGGIADSTTLSLAEKWGLNLGEHLKNHRSSDFLRPLGGAILTGHTGTNLQNLRVVLIRDSFHGGGL